MIKGLLNHRMQTSIRPFVELIRNLEKNYIFSKHSQKKVMDDPSQKSMQGMAMPLAICNQILVQIRPSVQELSCLQNKMHFSKNSQKTKSQCRSWPYPWPSVTKFWSKSGHSFKSYRVSKKLAFFKKF